MEWIVKCVLFFVRNITAVEWLSVIHVFLLAFIVCVFLFISNFLLFCISISFYSSFWLCRTYTNQHSLCQHGDSECLPENTAERKSVIYSRKILYDSSSSSSFKRNNLAISLSLFHFHIQWNVRWVSRHYNKCSWYRILTWTNNETKMNNININENFRIAKLKAFRPEKSFHRIFGRLAFCVAVVHCIRYVCIWVYTYVCIFYFEYVTNESYHPLIEFTRNGIIKQAENTALNGKKNKKTRR